MDILKRISQSRKGGTVFPEPPEEAVFVFNGVLGEAIVRTYGFAGSAVKVIAAFSEKPVQSNYYEVFEQEKMSNLVPRLAVKLAFICVPHKQAAYIAEQLIKCGVKRIVNWSGEFLTADAADVEILNEEPPSINSNLD